MKIIFQGGASVPASWSLPAAATARGDERRVPQEQLKIARHFNAGFSRPLRQVPEGRPTRQRFSRPGGTGFVSNLFPALKRRAIVRKSRWDSILFTALVLFFAVRAAAETTNTFSDAEIQGRKLAQQLCEARPVENFTNTGILKIRNGNGKRIEPSLTVETTASANSWKTFYSATLNLDKDRFGYALLVTHSVEQLNAYHSTEQNFAGHFEKDFSGNETMTPFAGSDFWLCDLGLEFFHWPAQKVLPNPTRLVRGRAYTLLESTNPNPSTNGYSRVKSWIDQETGGILQAEAYDVNSKLLKEFAPKSFKKVNGQWELQEMEIRNVQTGSRTRLEFDLKK